MVEVKLAKAEQELADNKQAVGDLKAAAGRLRDRAEASEARERELREALQAMWDQFSYDGNTGGLSALEEAQAALQATQEDGAA